MWRALAMLGIVLCVRAAGLALTQEPNGDLPKPAVNIAKLSPPIYPPLARQARISGEVKIEVRIGATGNVESALPLSGPPLLIPASLESAKKSLFECEPCTDAKNYVLTYVFNLTPVDRCPAKGEDPAQQNVSQLSDRITVSAYGLIICDPSVAIEVTRFRSPKCLYLWECGRREKQLW
jgi:hypothetical protein